MKQKQTRSFSLVIMMLTSLAVFSRNIENCYINMPDRLNPTMTKKIRMEMLEYHKAGQGDSIQNVFGNLAYLLTFDTLNNFIAVKNTKSSTFEMKLMKNEQGMPFIGIIRSVCAPICQSSIEFYDTAWNKIPLQFIMPKAIQWVNKEKLAASTDLDKTWVEKALENTFVSLQFDAKNQFIIATNNSVEFLSVEDRKVISPLLNEQPITFQLRDRAWVQKP